MIAEHGRKFFITIFGVVCVMILCITGMVLALISTVAVEVGGLLVPVGIGAIAGMIATFITGNSAITFAYAKYDTTSRATEDKEIIERREATDSYERTP